MSPAIVLMLVIGLPLILVAAGFLILVTKAFSGRDGRAERTQTLEAARQLERALSAMESRLTALEDIIISTGTPKEDRHE